MKKNKKISIIMPCFNEGQIVKTSPLKIANILQTHYGDNFEIITVNDGSTDETLASLKEAQQHNSNIQIITYPKNKGKGFAVKKGIAAANSKLVGFIDSDLEIAPESIPLYIKKLEHNQNDIIIGSKYHPESKLQRQKRRQLLSKVSNKMIQVLFQLKGIDSQVGLKIFKKEVAENVMSKVKTNSFAFDIEFLVLAKKENYKIESAPVEIKQINSNNSNVGTQSIIRTFLDMMKLHHKMKKHIKHESTYFKFIRLTLLATLFIPLEYLYETISDI